MSLHACFARNRRPEVDRDVLSDRVRDDDQPPIATR